MLLMDFGLFVVLVAGHVTDQSGVLVQYMDI